MSLFLLKKGRLLRLAHSWSIKGERQFRFFGPYFSKIKGGGTPPLDQPLIVISFFST